MNRTTSSRRKRWFFARALARAYSEMLEKRRTKRAGAKAAKQRPLFAEALEPRVLFSATPMPADSEEVEGGQNDNAAQTAEMLESVVDTDATIDGIPQAGFDDKEDLNEEDIERLAQEAVARWEASGLTEEQIEALEKVNYEVSDLGGLTIAFAEGDTIYIDDDAAGLDWFIDQTESLDEEFVGYDGYLEALTDQALEGIDLLSVIMHEQGHILGLADVYDASEVDGLMYGGFEEGIRKLPEVGEAENATIGAVQRAAATLTVDQAGDDATAEGNGLTLREAISQAAAGDTIVLAGNTTYTLSQGQLTINKDLIFQGGDKLTTVIDGAGASRVFNITGTADVGINDLTITGGFVTEGNGGGILHSGGVLTLADVIIDGNEVQDTVDNNTNALGGGLYNNNRTVIATNTDFTNNSATRNGGNETSGGGGIFSNGGSANLTITGGSISNNTAREGGGVYIWSQGATATFDGVTIDGNRANSVGGGFRFHDGVTIDFENGLTLSNNSANSSGGGGYISAASTVNMNDGAAVAVTGNKVANAAGTSIQGSGGGFYVHEGSSLNLDNATIENNEADDGAGFYVLRRESTVTGTNVTIRNNTAEVRGGGFRVAQEGANVNLTNSVIEGNRADTEYGGGFYNSGNVTLHDTTIVSNSNGVNADDHGGGFFNTFRSVVNITGTSAATTQIANNSSSGHGGGFWNRNGEVNINLDGGVTDFVISNNAAGVNQNSGRGGGGFWATDASTTKINDAVFTSNEVSDNASGVIVGVGAGFDARSGSRVELTDVQITGHTASEGGAFYATESGTTVIGTNVTLDGNTARVRGGGFRLANANATVELTDSSVNGNTASNEHGGGFYNNGTVTLTNTSVDGNMALDLDASGINLDGTAGVAYRRDSYGGGFYNTGGTVNLLDGTTVQNNDTYGHGAGFFTTAGLVNGTDTIISGNEIIRDVATKPSTGDGDTIRNGGGFASYGDGRVNLTNATISGNRTGLDDSGGTDILRGSGGGFFNGDGSSVTIDGTSVINDNDAQEGGGFYNTSTGGTVTITGADGNSIEINNNDARVRGGAFRSTGNTTVNLKFVQIDGNEAFTQRGGGIYADGAAITGDEVTISNNAAGSAGRTNDEQGGGFWLDGNGSVTLTNSAITGNTTVVNGGGFYVQDGTVDLTNTLVSGNYSNNSGAGFFNENKGIVRITGSQVINNIARDHGGGFWSEDDSQTFIDTSLVSDNLAGFADDGATLVHGRDGGAFFAGGRAQVTVTGSEIARNEATNVGGAARINNEAAVSYVSSSIVDNLAHSHGGAFWIQNSSELDLTNSTISGNIAGYQSASNGGISILRNNGRGGGAIWASNNAVADLNHTTVTGNAATENNGGGFRTANTAMVRAENSIMFGNLRDIDGSNGGPTAEDARNGLTLIGANVLGVHRGTGSGGLTGDTANRITTNPNLGDIADNGGATLPGGGSPRTHSISAGSSAEDAAIASRNATDQLGNGRLNSVADLGAFEADPVATTLTLDKIEAPEVSVAGKSFALEAAAITTGAGPLTYRWDIYDAAGNPVEGSPATGASTTFTHPTNPTNPVEAMRIESAVLTVTDTTTGQVVVSDPQEITVVNPEMVPDETSANVTVLTVDNTAGNTLRDHIAAANSGAGNYVITFASALDFSTTAAAVYTAGGVGDNNVVAAGTNDDGNANGDLDINKTNGFISIVGNGADETILDGGGIDRVFHVLNGSTVFFSDLTIQNGATKDGTDSHGGGVCSEGGTTVFKDVDVINNTAGEGGNDDNGGGIYLRSTGVNPGHLIMTRGSVANNQAEDNGGGIFVESLGVGETMVYLDETKIDGNIASSADSNLDDNRGGGFYFTGSGNRIIFDEVVVQDNKTNGRNRGDGGGGAFSGADHTIEVTGGSFVRNQTGFDGRTGGNDSDGGGFWSNATRSQFTFTGTQIGGALDGSGQIVDGNVSEDDGGGFYLEGRNSVYDFIDVKIEGNMSGDSGGGFMVVNNTDTVNFIQTGSGNSYIKDNYSRTEHGGGFRNDGGVVNINQTDSQGNASVGIFEISGNQARPNGALLQSDGTGAGNADRVGGGFYTSSNSVTNLQDVEIKNNIANRRGGGFFASGGSTVTITSSSTSTSGDDSSFISKIQNNHTVDAGDGDGGGFYVSTANSTVSLTDVLLADNTATDDGGGFLTQSNFSETSLTRVDVVRNTAQDAGGGFSNESNGSKVILDTVLIDSNISTTLHGGGFRNSGIVDGNLVMVTNNSANGTVDGLVNTALINNRDHVGGGIYNNGGRLTLEDAKIENNRSYSRGGGVFNNGGGVVKITSNTIRSSISNNVVDQNSDQNNQQWRDYGSGGGVYQETAGSLINLTGVDVIGNEAKDDGGGLFLESDGSEANFTDVLIQGNKAGDEGGGFKVNASGVTVQLENVAIIGNQSETILAAPRPDNQTLTLGDSGHGGGIRNAGHIIGNNVTISGNEAGVQDRIAQNNSNNVGGGLYSSGGSANVKLTNVAITSNKSHGRGGGIYNADGVVSLTDFVIANNATDQLNNEGNGRAGGLWNSGNGDVTLNGGTIANNTSFGHSGGIHNQDTGSTIDATNVTVSGNRAGWDPNTNTSVNNRVAGGLWALSGGRADVTFRHSTFADNETTRDGGDGGSGLRIENGGKRVVFENSIIYGNERDVDGSSGGPFEEDIDNNIGGNATTGLYFVGTNIVGKTAGTITGGTILRSDPNLEALADNGGPTVGATLGNGNQVDLTTFGVATLTPVIQTHAIGSDSLAADAAVDSTSTEDARNAARLPIGADLGAFELSSPEIVDASLAVTVAPESQSGAGNVANGGTVTLTGEVLYDVVGAVAEAVTVTVDWGDGSPLSRQTFPAGTDFTATSPDFSFDHAYSYGYDGLYDIDVSVNLFGAKAAADVETVSVVVDEVSALQVTTDEDTPVILGPNTSVDTMAGVFSSGQLLLDDSEPIPDGNRLGWAVDIDSDPTNGTWAIVGSEGQSYREQVHIYKLNETSGEWELNQTLENDNVDIFDDFGFAVNIDAANGRAFVGAHLDDTGGGDKGAAYYYELDGSDWVLRQKIQTNTGSDGGDNFGFSLDADGDLLVIGAINEDADDATSQTDRGGSNNSGAVYVWRYNAVSNQYDLEQKIKAQETDGSSDVQGNDQFGRAVAISGETIVVGQELEDDGGNNAGAAYVYTYDVATTSWAIQQKITASNQGGDDRFGYDVDIDMSSGDNGRIVVGARQEDSGGSNRGSIYVFEYDGLATTWTETQRIGDTTSVTALSNDDRLGGSVAIDGDTILSAAYQDDPVGSNSGRGHIFTHNGTAFEHSQSIVASDASDRDELGLSVALSGDTYILGARLAQGTYITDEGVNISLPRHGAAYIYNGIPGSATETAKLDGGLSTTDLLGGRVEFGRRVAIGGDYALVGAPGGGIGDNRTTREGAGSAYLYRRNDFGTADPSDDTWSLLEKLTLSDVDTSSETGDQFGFGVAIAADGSSFAIGAFNHDDGGDRQGAVYVYTVDTATGAVALEGRVRAAARSTTDEFGRYLSMNEDGSVLAVGMRSDDDDGGGSGAVLVYGASGGDWNNFFSGAALDNNGVLSIQSDGVKLKPIGDDGTAPATASDEFGRSVAISGNRIVVGAFDDDHVGGVGPDDNGNVPARDRGSAYVFDSTDGVTWNLTQKLFASNDGKDDRFGWGVDVDGDTIVVGANQEDSGGFNRGSAYIFELDAGTWTEVQRIQASNRGNNDQFGRSVSIDNDVIVVGAYLEDTSGTEAGAAYVFQKDSVAAAGSQWSETDLLAAPDGSSRDGFGLSVAIDQGNIIVGANQVDRILSDGTVVANWGAAYTYRVLPAVSPGVEITSVTQPAAGSVSIIGTGTSTELRFDPGSDFDNLNSGESAEETFIYTTSTGDSATVTVTIEGRNDTPVAVDDGGANLTVSEDRQTDLSGNVLTNDSDDDSAPGNVLTVSSVQNSTAGVGTVVETDKGALLTLNADGTFTYNLNGKFEHLASGESEADTARYRVTDSQGEIIYQEIDGAFVGDAFDFSSNPNSWILRNEGNNNPQNLIGSRTGTFMQVQENSGGIQTPSLADPTGAPALTFQVEVKTAGEYQLFLRAASFDSSSDSVYVAIDGEGDGLPGAIPDWYYMDVARPGGENRFSWNGNGRLEGTGPGGGQIPVTFDLEVGIHTLHISAREDGVALDAFVLRNTTSTVTAPSGTEEGPKAQQEATLTILVEGQNDAPSAANDFIVGDFSNRVFVSNAPSIVNGRTSLDTILTNDGIVSGALLNYAAQNNFDADNGIESDREWPNTGLVSGGNFTLESGVSFVDVTGSAYAGLGQAYSFDGSTSAIARMQGDSPQDIGVNTAKSASIEMWIRPDSLTGGDQNLWETGGGTGAGLVIRNNQLVFRVIPGTAVATYDLNEFNSDFGYDPTSDFLHVVGAIDLGNNFVELFVNGQSVSRGQGVIFDWDGGDGAAIGHFGGDNQGGFGGGASGIDEYFEGDVASFRLYGERNGGTGNGVVFTEAQALQNFKAINAGTDIDGNTIVASGLVDLVNDGTGNTIAGIGTQITLASGALVTLDDAAGTFTYDPNQVFDSLELGEVGTDTFTYQITEALSAAEINAGAVPFTSTATVTVQIHGVANVVDDTVQGLAEDNPSTIFAATLIANDQTDRSVRGASLDYNANTLLAGTTVWTGSADTADNWNFGTNVTLESVTSVKFSGVTQAFRFDGSGGSVNRGINDLAGNPSDADATWEFVLQPDNLGADDQIIYETGGAGDGMAIWYSRSGTANDLDVLDGVGTIHFTIDNGDVQQTVSAALGQDDFSHVALAYNKNASGGRDEMQIFVDGFLRAAAITDNLENFDGGDSAGLGNVGGARAESVPAGAANFTGDMSIFRFYEKSLNSIEVIQNFIAVRSLGASVLTVSADDNTTGTVSYDPGTRSITYTPSGQDSLAFGEPKSDTFVYTSLDGTEVSEILGGSLSLQARGTAIQLISDASFGDVQVNVQEVDFATTPAPAWTSTGATTLAFQGEYGQEPGLSETGAGEFAKLKHNSTLGTTGSIGQNTAINWADLEVGDTITVSGSVGQITGSDLLGLDVQLTDGTIANGVVPTGGAIVTTQEDVHLNATVSGDLAGFTFSYTVQAADLTRLGTVNLHLLGDATGATADSQIAFDDFNLFIDSGNNPTNSAITPTPATTFIDLKNVNGGDFASGDILNISGTNADGSSITGSFTITDVDTNTLGDFLDAVNAILTDSAIGLGDSGELILVADSAGDAELSLTIASDGSNVGNTDGSPLGTFAVEAEGRDATGATTTATVNVGIRGENDPITANDDTYTITQAENGTVAIGNIMTEGTGADIDIDSKQVIISEDFSGVGALNGSSTETGGLTWTAGTQWNADGTKTVSGDSNAFVPFQPAEGRVYTLSMTVNPDVSTSSDWFAVGFSNNTNSTGPWHTSGNTVSGWMLIRENDALANSVRTFETEATSGTTSSDHPSPGDGPIDVQIVLDTRAADWAVQWYADGKLLRTATFDNNPTINYAGFGAFGTANGSVSNFQITENVVVAITDAIVVAVDDDTSAVGTQVTVGEGALVTVNLDGSVSVDANGAYFGGTNAEETFSYVVADQNVQTVGLAAHLNFGETAVDPGGADDPATLDISGKGNNGTLVGNPLVEDSTSPVGGTMVTLDGNGDYVTLGGYKGIDGSDARTTSAWINSSVPGAAGGDGIMAWGTNAVGEKWVWRIADTGGRMRVEVNGGGVESTTNVADGNWHHVAVVYDGSGNLNGVQFYVDGVLERKAVNSTFAITTAAAGTDVFIGTDRVGVNNTSRDFAGDIDDAAIWERALSAQDISDIYQTAIGQGHSFQEHDTATVTITIVGQNVPPVANVDTNTAVEASGLNDNVAGIDPIGNVMANDTDADPTDNPAAGDGTVSVTEITFGANTVAVNGLTVIEGLFGTLAINPDGSYEYEVDPAEADSLGEGDTRTEQFTYTVADDDGASSQSTLTITVEGANDNPTADAQTKTVYEGGVSGPEVTIGDVMIADVDDGATFGISQVTSDNTGASGAPTATDPAVVGGAFGSISMNADGTFVYSVDSGNGNVQALRTGDTSTEVFTFQVADENGDLTTETITITIEGQDGIAVNDVFITGGSGVLEGFRFAESSVFDDREEEGSSSGIPLLTLIPTYYGSAAPGSVIQINVFGRNGEMLSGGQMTVVADMEKNWVANFDTLVLGDSQYFVQVETKPSTWGPSQPGVFQTFQASAINPTFSESEGLSVNSIFGRRLSTVGMELLNEANSNPGGTAGNGPLNPQHLPLDLQQLILPGGVDENGSSGQGLPAEGEEED